MATLIVPPIEPDEDDRWPTLGDQVAEWLEANAVFGPGSKYGKPVEVDDEFYAWLRRAYQVYPHDHARAGRRRFAVCAQELAKGTGKTERALIVAQAEIHPTAPVRCVGFDGVTPIGGPVPYPRLVFVASSEDQVQRTAFGRFVKAMRKSPLAADFHITQDKVVLLGADGGPAGEAEPIAVSGASADGDLPTWQHVDEPHRWDKPRHHEMFDTIIENPLKDVTADAWTMPTSTAGELGANSVEEQLHETARAIDRGEVSQPGMFFMRRYAPDDMPLVTEEDVEAFVLEARGPAAEWSGDIPRIVAKFFDPKTNRNYWRRVWGNQWVAGAGKAFDPSTWADRANADGTIADGRKVTVGFDGARRHDSTGIVVTDVETGLQIVAGLWERPLRASDDWEIDALEVDEALAAVFDRWDVWRMYGDPPYWDDWFPAWEGKYGEKRVIRWWTNRLKAMAYALARYEAAMVGGGLSHDGNERYADHIANAYRRDLATRTDDDRPLWIIQKERPDSPNKIDLAMAGCLSWEARCDAITAGALNDTSAPAGSYYW